MKLISAVGIDDFSNPSMVNGYSDNIIKRLGITDLFHSNGHPSYAPTPTPGKGLYMTAYSNQTTFMMKDIIADYPTGECWVAMGIMIDPAIIAAANGVFFTTIANTQYNVGAFIGTLTRNDIIGIHGQNKRCCVELIWRPATGQFRVYVNGVMRDQGTFSLVNTISYPLVGQSIGFNAFSQQDTTSRFYFTDFYIGVVGSINECMGNFKVTKLVAKNTTLNAAGMTPGGAAQLTTGDHTVEFDTAPLAGSIVAGVVETIRAYSPGPTAAVTTKRTVNGVETAERKAANLPVAITSLATDEVVNKRVMAPPAAYAIGTPLTEYKLALSIVNN
ncbi:hypothetical protein D3C85_341570 [compost metagenome]